MHYTFRTHEDIYTSMYYARNTMAHYTDLFAESKVLKVAKHCTQRPPVVRTAVTADWIQGSLQGWAGNTSPAESGVIWTLAVWGAEKFPPSVE